MGTSWPGLRFTWMPFLSLLDCLDWSLWCFPPLKGVGLIFGFDGKYHDGVTGTCGATSVGGLALSPEKAEAQAGLGCLGKGGLRLFAGVLPPKIISISARAYNCSIL